MNTIRTVFLIIFILFFSRSASADDAIKPNLPMAELLHQGKVVYEKHCIGCHGVKGDGAGVAAYGLLPKPRNFTSGIFKFKTTNAGALPTDEDLYRSIRQGILGASMPAYPLMPEPDVLAVIQYIKTFSPKWEKQKPIPSLAHIGAVPNWFTKEKKRQEKAQAGQKTFEQYCVACHGATGKGDGFAMKNLKDTWGQKIVPADLRKPYIKSGRSLSDIYKVLVVGVNGTPMPSYQDAATEEQLWEVVAYIDQLRRDHKKKREQSL